MTTDNETIPKLLPYIVSLIAVAFLIIGAGLYGTSDFEDCYETCLDVYSTENNTIYENFAFMIPQTEPSGEIKQECFDACTGSKCRFRTWVSSSGR